MQSEELAETFCIKLNARFMPTINVDLQEKLVNRQFGTVKHIVLNSQNNVSKIYIKFVKQTSIANEA